MIRIRLNRFIIRQQPFATLLDSPPTMRLRPADTGNKSPDAVSDLNVNETIPLLHLT
jgi:hypothetical protein